MIVTACPLLLFSFISNCCPLHKPFGVILCCVYFSHLNPLHVFVKPLNSVIYLHTYSLFPLFSSSLGKFVRWSFCFFLTGIFLETLHSSCLQFNHPSSLLSINLESQQGSIHHPRIQHPTFTRPSIHSDSTQAGHMFIHLYFYPLISSLINLFCLLMFITINPSIINQVTQLKLLRVCNDSPSN